MKSTYIITLLSAGLFFAGCASSEKDADGAVAEETPAMGEEEETAKTAYEGSTGSGLLMERYKSGSIEGYRE